jgi:phosphatidate phosphatase APP1
MLAFAAGAIPALADEPALLLPPSLGRSDTVWVGGRILEEAHGRHGPAALRNVRTLSASNLEGARVEVRFNGRTGSAISGRDGEFEVEIPAAPGSPFPPGSGTAEVSVGLVTATAAVVVVSPDTPFIVVSDFDDTVAITHVQSTPKLLATTFLEDGDSQPAVPGMASFYQCLAATGRPPPAFAFVSGSPVQFAPRVGRFLGKNGFPPAALYLRNLGLNTLAGYKEPILRKLAARFTQSLVLIGDSGEKDPEIYAALSRQLPGRVRRIYIRRAGPPGPPARFEGMCLFEDASAAVRDAQTLGLAPEACP